MILLILSLKRLANNFIKPSAKIYSIQLWKKKWCKMDRKIDCINEFINDMPLGVMRFDPENRTYLYFNHFFTEMFGWNYSDIQNIDNWLIRSFPDEKDRDKVKPLVRTEIKHTKPISIKIHCKDGSFKWCEATFYKKVNSIFGIFRDITQSYESEERLRFALAGATDGLWEWNLENNEVYFSPRWFDMLGYEFCEMPLVFETWERLMDPDQIEPVLNQIQKYLNGTIERFETEFRMKHKNGHWISVLSRAQLAKDKDGKDVEPRRLVGTHVDISERIEYQNKLEHIARYDPLTNLPNRTMLTDGLNKAIANTKRRKSFISVIYLDLDGFKKVNDTYGHSTGDKLLVSIANNISNTLREGDSLARLGGDEFIIILEDLKEIESSLPIIQRIIDSLSTWHTVDDTTLRLTASLGVTFYPQQEQADADLLIRQADNAMYTAKKDGKNRYSIFDNQRDHDFRLQQNKARRVREALANDEFEMYYQPKVNLYTGKVVGAEALIRWNHPERGVLPPAEFLPLLDKHKDMISVDKFVFNKTMKQVEQWKSAGMDINLSVNIDGNHLQHADFIKNLTETMKQYPLVEPKDIQLEIVETSILQDTELVSNVMRQCQELGYGFAIDDFGTGYSSLTYLKQLPAKVIKLDKSFVIDMLNDTDDLAIIDGILGLSNVFGRQVVAEGVESVLHGEVLLRMGCVIAQGYAIAKPMDVDSFEKWVKEEWKPFPELLKLKSLSRDKVSILYATIAHRIWINSLLSYFKGEISAPKAHDLEPHQLSKWLNKGDVDKIDKIHKDIHELYDSLYKEFESDNSEFIESNTHRLTALRDKFVRAILDSLN